MSDPAAPPRTWRTHACRRVRDGQWVYANFGAEQRLRILFPNTFVVPVALTQDPDGSHWGWICGPAGGPRMIQPSEHQFAVQFRYDWQSEQECGYGRMVRLRVEQIVNDKEEG